MPERNHKQKTAADNGAGFPRADLMTAEPPQETASFMEEKAEQAVEALGAGMESLGETIRRHPGPGVLGNAGEAVANKLEASGHYLEEKGLKGIGEDITGLIRRNPVPALLIGVGIGILIARLVRR